MSVNPQEKILMMYQRISQARNQETKRVADILEAAMYEAKSDEVRDALIDIAVKVLKP